MNLSEDPYILAIWLSPSGKGLKFLCYYNKNKYGHLQAFEFIDRYFFQEYNIRIDESCKDVVRACFVSSDKDLIYNKIIRV